MIARRLSRRLGVVVWAPALAGLAVATPLLVSLVPGLAATNTAETLEATLDLLAPVVAERVEILGDALQPWVATHRVGDSVRLTVIDPDGRVVADSFQTVEGVRTMDDHSNRPEVVAAVASGRGSSTRWSRTLSRELVYAARTVQVGESRYVVRLARPLSALSSVRRRVYGVLLLGLAVAGGSALVVAEWFRRHFLGPLGRILTDAERLAQGDLGLRLAEPSSQELQALARSLNRLAAGVQAQIERARSERDHLREILASMSDGVLVTSGVGEPILANAAFRRLFGLSALSSTAALLDLARLPQLQRMLGQVLDRESEAAEETVAVGGRSLALQVFHLESSLGALVVVRDTTETERLQRVRRDFVANVSHEIKTPLAAIRGAAETLAEGALEDPPAAHRFVGRLVEQGRRLQEIVDDLLTLSRFEDPRELHLVPVDLGRTAGEVVHAAAPFAERKGIELRVEGSAPPVLGDRAALERLLFNLVDNAIKYNRDGGWVEIRLGGDGRATLEVGDSGEGIPGPEVERIFERFYRIDKGRGRAEGGSGLGLAIVKHVAGCHGATVEVESTPGRGATFRVTFPSAAAGEPADPRVAGAAEPPRPT